MDEPGVKNIGLGLVWLIGGSLVTFVTYQSPANGHYVLAYGAIIGGALQFIVGLYQYNRG
jgi:peptidoglycan biosynthesis protein MviN/MurJ (putative lipid II flippase)